MASNETTSVAERAWGEFSPHGTYYVRLALTLSDGSTYTRTWEVDTPAEAGIRLARLAELGRYRHERFGAPLTEVDYWLRKGAPNGD